MKKTLLFTLGLCLCFMQTLLAQNEGKAGDMTVPSMVVSAFNTKYPNMKVTDWDWEEDKGMFEAEFKMGGRDWEAYFSPEGAWEKTKASISKAQLPAAVSKAMTSGEYNTWKMDDFMEMDTPDKGKLYKMEAEKGKERMYLKFDASGKMVESKTKEAKKMQKK